MLVITRRPGESFYIGDDIKVTIIEKICNQIRIGIKAPNHIPVHREEIYLKILREKAFILSSETENKESENGN